jgi:hypothetical protein
MYDMHLVHLLVCNTQWTKIHAKWTNHFFQVSLHISKFYVVLPLDWSLSIVFYIYIYILCFRIFGIFLITLNYVTLFFLFFTSSFPPYYILWPETHRPLILTTLKKLLKRHISHSSSGVQETGEVFIPFFSRLQWHFMCMYNNFTLHSVQNLKSLQILKTSLKYDPLTMHFFLYTVISNSVYTVRATMLFVSLSLYSLWSF